MENNQVNRYRGVWKIISLIIAVFLIIPMFCACDFGYDKTDDTNENTAVISDGMIVGESQGSGVVTLTSKVIPVSEYADYGVSPLAVTAITVTATVSPVNATIKELDWSLAWDQEAEDSDGDCFYTDNYFYYDEEEGTEYEAKYLYLIGLTEYDFVSISPSSDTLQCVLECRQPFGCPITLTVSSVSNPDVFDTCRIDFKKRFEGIFITDSISLRGSFSTSTSSIFASASLSVGTLCDDYTLTLTIDGGVSWVQLFDDLDMRDSNFFELPYACYWLVEAYPVGPDGFITSDDYDEEDYVISSENSSCYYSYSTYFETFASQFFVGGLDELTGSERLEVLEQVRQLCLVSEFKEALETYGYIFKAYATYTNNVTGEKSYFSQEIYLTGVPSTPLI